MSKVAIFCEGRTDIQFLKTLIEHMASIENTTFRKDDVIAYVMDCKSNFFNENHKKYIQLQQDIEGSLIKNILFVLDSDDVNKDVVYGGYQNTIIELDKVIKNLSLNNISQIYVMCDPITKNGNLESLILSTIDPKLRNCIECFLDCSQIESKENHKAILNQIYNIAYPNAPYNFAHPHFDELKEKLRNLFTTDL